ncbi:pilus assembly protein PilE [Chromobacterium phragmitis]|uniref:Pilus assembly protein PilE n=1 Tax=Chromobacterium phragmitis TaxID=2202141 RepID=A0A344UKI3_9NEIS|nr:type IV pilin protein [Chromobacterium phragmitis]AXE30408.1 pilus assembly protein PilE [Chromobacterium phragmitis]AXE35781.1 pilus assembly protein PilE [Chromobacterium phragmitis]
MTRPRHAIPSRFAGFSLLELLIALAVAAALAGIAVPAYQGHMQRSRRSDALEALYRLQQAQLRYRGFHSTYASTLADLKTPYANGASAQGHYQLATGAGDDPASDFYVRAQAKPGGIQAGDRDCQTLTLVQRQQTVSLAPPACWGR